MNPYTVSPYLRSFPVEPAEPQVDLGWQDRALCAEVDPEIFFPEKGGSTRAAKSVCRSCEVRAECLEFALEHDERFGIYGGKSERERRQLRYRFGRDIAAAVASALPVSASSPQPRKAAA